MADYLSHRRDGANWDAHGPTILMYHKVAAPPLATRLPALYVSPAGFRRQLDGLATAGVPCLSLDQALTGANTGFCLTFDDGFRNVFEHALPLLHARKTPAIQFIVAGLIGRTDEWDHPIGEPPLPLMDDAQIRDWLAAGNDVGAHTMTHPRLAQLPLDRARAEIFDCKRALEDRFGRAVRHFCYPYGNYNPAVSDLVQEAGYASACTIDPGRNSPATDRFQLQRRMAVDPCSGWRRLTNAAARKLRL